MLSRNKWLSVKELWFMVKVKCLTSHSPVKKKKKKKVLAHLIIKCNCIFVHVRSITIWMPIPFGHPILELPPCIRVMKKREFEIIVMREEGIKNPRCLQWKSGCFLRSARWLASSWTSIEWHGTLKSTKGLFSCFY